VTVRYLLDTNILSALLRDPDRRLQARMVEVSEAAVATSIIAAAELRFGARRKGSARLTMAIEGLLIRIPVLPWMSPMDQVYADMRTALEQKGTLVGPNDMLIAAHALRFDAILVTGNTREFARVPGLRLENWLAG
jgi:tRNA(fMet)-specific endonuclease VapC